MFFSSQKLIKYRIRKHWNSAWIECSHLHPIFAWFWTPKCGPQTLQRLVTNSCQASPTSTAHPRHFHSASDGVQVRPNDPKKPPKGLHEACQKRQSDLQQAPSTYFQTILCTSNAGCRSRERSWQFRHKSDCANWIKRGYLVYWIHSTHWSNSFGCYKINEHLVLSILSYDFPCRLQLDDP